MGARVSHIFWWVRRADGTPRKPDRLGGCFDGPARGRMARVPGDDDLSALAMLEPPVRLERFSLETFGEPDLVPCPDRSLATTAVMEEDVIMERDIDQPDRGFRADE